MNNEELVNVKGGISAAVMNVLLRTVNLALEIGRLIGSAIKRKVGKGKYAC